VDFHLYHNNIDGPAMPTLSPGWSHSYSRHLEFTGPCLTIGSRPGPMGLEPVFISGWYVMDDGRRIFVEQTKAFTNGNGPLDLPPGIRLALQRVQLSVGGVTTVTYVMKDAHQNINIFNEDGVLIQIRDASGNALSFTRDTDGRLTGIADAAG